MWVGVRGCQQPLSLSTCRICRGCAQALAVRARLPRAASMGTICVVNAQLSNAGADFRREDGAQPPSLFPPYASTVERSPREPLLRIPQTPTEQSGPGEWEALFGAQVTDLTCTRGAPALGQRIIVCGQVLDEDRRPVARTLIEMWQANAAGRYAHERDQWDAPLDPNFSGAGRVVTDEQGLSLYHGATGRLSVGQSLQCLASGAHSPLAHGSGIRHAPRHADVLSRRPADRD